ncbi:DUF2726 domain-containing protein [Halomonas sp. JS92-SW72]|uniref:DUF2726 domain-containing protein n=1 Tax=Halomonas sp. JS92-SW72 TaxID=2306583 RepID=UPI000E5AEA49|nr:DUF2726 domain-containing protein [Halomonas sp. JS92-SW72]AXY43782.1 DUF2726 domain-containing protein [Halomonas sp. JS92-SW72]
MDNMFEGLFVNIFGAIWPLLLMAVICYVLLELVRKSKKKGVSKGKKNNKHKNYSELLMEKGQAYRKKEYFMTPVEREVYKLLERSYGDRYRIFSQVRVVDVVEPDSTKHHSKSREFMSLFRQLSQWHFDYVLCERDSFKVYCALELDDASHEREDRIKRDRILDMACKNAGLELKRMRINHEDRSVDVTNR